MKLKKSIALLLAGIFIVLPSLTCYAEELVIDGPVNALEEITVESEDIDLTGESTSEEDSALCLDGDPMANGDAEPEPVSHKVTLKLGLTGAGTLTSYLDGVVTKEFFGDEIVEIEAKPATHFYFVNWETDNEEISFEDDTDTITSFIMPNEDVTITANFTEDDFVEISYAPGKYATTTNRYGQKKYRNSKLTLRTKSYNCVKPNAYQSGWSKSPDGDTLDYAFADGNSISQAIIDAGKKPYVLAAEEFTAMTLYPYFSENHTVTIIPDENCAEDTVYTYTKYAGAALSIPTTLYTRKDGDETISQYGWRLQGGENKRYYKNSVTASMDEDIVLLPVWEKLYTVHYLPDTYSSPINGEDDLFTLRHQSIVDKPDAREALAGILFTRPNYIQTGWTSHMGSTTSEYSLKSTAVIPSDITLYPVWHTNYTITYNPGTFVDGPVIKDEKIYKYKYIVRGAEYKRNGYVQTGWSKSAAGTTLDYTFKQEIPTGTNASMTLYPYWEELVYPVSVDGVTVRGSNADDILEDGTMSFDTESNTLNLNSVQITSNEYYVIKAELASEGETRLTKLNINITGENVINAENGMAIASKIPVHISGDGSLDIISDYRDANYDGLLTVDKNISVEGRLTEEDEDYVKVDNFETALSDYEFLKFEQFNEEHKGELSGYVYVGNTRVTRGKLSGEGWSYDIESETLTIDDLDIREFGQINVDGQNITTGIYSDYDLNLVINGACAVGSSINKPDYAIYTKGKISVSGTGFADIYGNYGIASTGNAGFYGGRLNIRSDSDAIFGIDDFTLNGSVMEIISGRNGIASAGNFKIWQGELSVTAVDAAVSALGNTNIYNGSLEVNGGKTALYTRHYTQTNGQVKFESTDDADFDTAGTYYALDVLGNISLTGGSLYTESQYQAINAGGYIALNGGDLKCRDRNNDNTTACLIKASTFDMHAGVLDCVSYAMNLFLTDTTKAFDYQDGTVHLETTTDESKIYCTNAVMTHFPVLFWYKTNATIYWTSYNAALTLTSKLFVDLAINHTVSYLPGNGVDGARMNVPKISGKPLNLQGALFKKDGYVQTGWATSDNGSKDYELNELFTSEKSLLLYPYWTKSAIVYYYKNADEEPVRDEVPLGDGFNLKGSIFESDEGFMQNGWTRDSASNDPEYSLSGRYTFEEGYEGEEPLSFYATWNNVATINYYSGLYGKGDDVTDSHKLFSSIKLKDRLFVRSGYFQSGWSETDGGEKKYELNEKIRISGDMVLYPFWTEGYVVEFRIGEAPGNGDVFLDNKYTEDDVYLIKNFGDKLILPGAIYSYLNAEDEYGDYAQLGWSTADNGDLEYNFGDTMTVDNNIVLYPVWGIDSMRTVVVADSYANINPKERIAIFDYNGSQIKPQVVVYDGKSTLTEGKDYTVSYKNNTAASMTAADFAMEGIRVTDEESLLGPNDLKKLPVIVITGKGDYSGVQNIYFSIKPMDIGGDNFTDSGDFIYEYSNKKVVINKPIPTISANINGKTVKLSKNKDFVVTYIGNSVFPGEEFAGLTTPGTYDVIAEGIGNYTGRRVVLATLTDKLPITKVTVKNAKSLDYTGEALTFDDIQVMYQKNILEEGKDYSIEYFNNINAGTGSFVLTGMGDYIGTKTFTFKINGIELRKVRMEGFANAFNFTGSDVTQQYIRFCTDRPDETIYFLQEGIDYTAQYTNNFFPGVATVVFKGIGGYTGEIKKTFKINGEALSKAKIENYDNSLTFEYDGTEKTLDGQDIRLVMTKSGISTTLKNLSYDEYINHENGYYISYINDITQKGNNINAGTVNVEFIGSGMYTGSIKKTFKITPYDLSMDNDNRIELIYDEEIEFCKSGAKALNGIIFNKDDGTAVSLSENSDYKVVYKNNAVATDLTGNKIPQFTISGKGNFKGSMEPVTFIVLSKSLNSDDIIQNAQISDKASTGKAGNFVNTVKLFDADGKALSAGSDYDKNIVFVYDENVTVINGTEEIERSAGDVADKKDIVPVLDGGTHMKAVISGKGNYNGTIELPYRITEFDISKCKITFNKKYYFNNGRPVIPSDDDFVVTIKNGKTEDVLDPSQYFIDYNSVTGSTGKGAAGFNLVGRDRFGGTLKAKYTILPKIVMWWFDLL